MDQCDWRVYQTNYSKPHVSNRVSKPNEETEPRKLNSSKRKRIRRKLSKLKVNILNFVGNNADGLGNKLESLESMLKENPAGVFIQETHFNRPGRIKTPSSKKYTWYELNRTSQEEETKKGMQESVLDFFVVCDKTLLLLTSMAIHELGQSSLIK